MKHNLGDILGVLDQRAHTARKAVRRDVLRTLDIAAGIVVVSDVDDEVVLAGRAVALDDICELLVVMIKSGQADGSAGVLRG